MRLARLLTQYPDIPCGQPNGLFRMKGEDMSSLRIAKAGALIVALVVCGSTSEVTFADCPADFGSTIPGKLSLRCRPWFS